MFKEKKTPLNKPPVRKENPNKSPSAKKRDLGSNVLKMKCEWSLTQGPRDLYLGRFRRACCFHDSLRCLRYFRYIIRIRCSNSNVLPNDKEYVQISNISRTNEVKLKTGQSQDANHPDKPQDYVSKVKRIIHSPLPGFQFVIVFLVEVGRLNPGINWKNVVESVPVKKKYIPVAAKRAPSSHIWISTDSFVSTDPFFVIFVFVLDHPIALWVISLGIVCEPGTETELLIEVAIQIDFNCEYDIVPSNAGSILYIYDDFLKGVPNQGTEVTVASSSRILLIIIFR
jgi:hypothetical protein